jgi:sialic acid synthase
MEKAVAIIPARGGSKRIRHKNTKELWGKPLIAYTIEASLGCPYIGRTIVSTEDQHIKEIALRYGAEVIDRPAELAVDEAKTEPVMLHVMRELKAQGREPGVVVLLQATSPLRRASDISAAFKQFYDEKADSLVSVTEEYRFYWKDGRPLNYSLESYLKRPRLMPGEVEPFLKENGAIYITRRDILLTHQNRLGGTIAVFRMRDDTELELDTRSDWMRLVRQKKVAAIGSNGTYIIAEIGCNHQGDVDVAKRMIEVAAYCGVDAVKLQKRDVKKCLTSAQYNKPYDNPNSFGKTYGEHREYLELTLDEHRELKQHAESLGLTYFLSAWDANSARDALELGCDLVKVPSACVTDTELLAVLDNSRVSVIASVGMSTLEEIDALVGSLQKARELYLLQCTSTYPCEFKDVNLTVIPNLKERYRGKVKGVGFSGHHLGIALDIAAVAMGAAVIERHFTLDRTSKGTDHAASLEPEGMRRLVRDIRAFEQARGSGEKKRLDCEKSAWEKLRKAK